MHHQTFSVMPCLVNDRCELTSSLGVLLHLGAYEDASSYPAAERMDVVVAKSLLESGAQVHAQRNPSQMHFHYCFLPT